MGQRSTILKIHLVNPSDLSFGIGVVAPRWQYVIAAATPRSYGDPQIVDEALEKIDLSDVKKGDVVGIGIHTSNALRGYTIGRKVRDRGAYVVFGGIHAGLFPDEAYDLGGAHSVVRGDGDVVWSQVLEDCLKGRPKPLYEGGRVESRKFLPARWDLMPEDRYMWASVQTVRGCPKHCSFCSVWKTDGQEPRQRSVDMVLQEIVELRRAGFRFIVLADDNFYPVTLRDIEVADRRENKDRRDELIRLRDERFELMARLEKLPKDTVLFTQITMEAAEDERFLEAMQRARIKGVLVGVESVTPEGLKSVYKNFNLSGEGLIERLQRFRDNGIHVLGSFIFGLPTDTHSTFEATAELADRAEIAFAQFVTLMVFPGTLDFERWAERPENAVLAENGYPKSRYWLVPKHLRPKLEVEHPSMSSDDIRAQTQETWDRFYRIGAIWRRSRFLTRMRSRLAFLLISKLYRQMYGNTGITSDSARRGRSVQWARWIAKPCRILFRTAPMPELQLPE